MSTMGISEVRTTWSVNFPTGLKNLTEKSTTTVSDHR